MCAQTLFATTSFFVAADIKTVGHSVFFGVATYVFVSEPNDANINGRIF